VRGWLAARSVSRGLPAPVPDSGGWRVDTGSEEERRRYVFATTGPGISALAGRITETKVPVKLCASAAVFGPLLPSNWEILSEHCMMIAGPVERPAPALPHSYSLNLRASGPVTHATISAPDGTLAATGYAAEVDGIFVYDRIAVLEAHRRRGLGRALMAALAEARADPSSREVLVATDAGAALYASIGWQVYAPYTTAALQKAR
jgi:GNAT superfamily N-acetyltransferase